MNFIEFHKLPSGRRVEVAAFYPMQTCRGKYLVPWWPLRAPTLVHYCFARDCPTGGKHTANYQYVLWELPS
jgi:hypothetical protein